MLIDCNSVQIDFQKKTTSHFSTTVPQTPSDRRVSIPWSQPSSMPISGPSHRHRFERCTGETPVKRVKSCIFLLGESQTNMGDLDFFCFFWEEDDVMIMIEDVMNIL